MESLNTIINKSIKSLDGPKYKLSELEKYYFDLQENEAFEVELTGLSKIKNWGFDENQNYVHDSKKFFSIKRVQHNEIENGIIHQSGIGVLGILSTMISGILHILVQFKEEPGNINKAQLSPTIQATKSNYSKAHGGSFPPYWEKFVSIPKDKYIIDSLQPEQGLRYWQKFNQNVIVETEYLEEQSGFKWMTIGQVLAFSKHDNSINSCLRSVLSLISFEYENNNKKLDKKIENLILKSKKEYLDYGRLHNNVKKFYSEEKDCFDFFSKNDNFSVKGVNVQIENREVPNWSQPIILESRNLYYVLLRLQNKKLINYVWSLCIEPGYVNGFAIGPTEIIKSNENNITKIKSNLIEKYKEYGNIKNIHTINMSEEGGRFWRVSVPHIIIDINVESKNFKSENLILLNEEESRKLILSELMGIEARSIFLLSKSLET